MKLSAVCSCFLMLAVSSMVAAESQTALLHCLHDGTTYSMVLVVYIKDDPVTVMYGVQSDLTKDTACVNAPGNIVMLGTSPNAYWKAVVTYDGSTFTSRDCSAVQPDAAVKTFNWKFATRQKPEPEYANMMFHGDMNYEATCNFATLQGNLITSTSIDVTGDTSSTLAVTEETVTFQVVQTDGTTSVTTSALGDRIKLKISLSAKLHGATGISPYNCKACDDSACGGSTTYTLTMQDGCYAANQHIAAQDTSAFTGDPATSLLTTDFVNFVFSGAGAKVWFVCQIDFCYGTTMAACEDRCLDAGKRRRRRSASEKNVTSTATLSIDVSKNADDRIRVNKVDAADRDELPGDDVCQVHLVFLGVTLSLTVLLVVAVVLSIRMYFLLGKITSNSPAKA